MTRTIPVAALTAAVLALSTWTAMAAPIVSASASATTFRRGDPPVTVTDSRTSATFAAARVDDTSRSEFGVAARASAGGQISAAAEF